MKKIILRNFLSPGDIVMLTAAVRDLHRCYPGQFLVDVRTSCPDLWENNPYLTRLDERDPQVTVLDCDYPLIARSNQTPFHCLHGFIDDLNEKLGLRINPTEFRGDIHISALEKSWYSQVQELSGEDTPYWIVVAGGKFDVTIKWWETSRYQKVIDHFRGRIVFVQAGENGHHHPKLEGVIDLRGQTNLRQFVRLIYHSQGVLCGVTAAMHLAAAVESKPGQPPRRPCVVVAGGREPVHWEAYPQHQFIHTVGQLPCCAHGGCWRARTTPMGDGDERDRADALCLAVVEGLPRCMHMITPREVIERIENYYRGGALRPLSEQQHSAAQKAIELTKGNPFTSGSPKRRQAQPNPGALLIQQASGVYTEMLELTHAAHAGYAQRHRFAYWPVRGDVQVERPPVWNKVLLIRMGLAAGFEFVAWLDADTLIVDPERNLREALPENAAIGMCRHPLPLGDCPWHYNAGVIFLRNSPAVRRFFDQVWGAAPVDHPWQEQVVINQLSREQPGLVHPLDDIWNSTEQANAVDDPVIRAWHGQGEKALPAMERAVARMTPRETVLINQVKRRNGIERHILPNEPGGVAAAGGARP